MKAIAYEIIDGHSIVRSIGEPTIDPELTKREARKCLERSEEYKTFDRAYRVCSGLEDATEAETLAAKVQLLKVLEDVIELRKTITKNNPVYFPVPGETNVLDTHADKLRKALSGLKDGELLTLDGEIVLDERGQRAWKLEDSGRWDYTTIAKLGEKLPEGYQRSESLSPVELNAIREQMDRDRIEAMSEDERRARAEGEIDAALDAIVRRHLRSQIKGEDTTSDNLRMLYEQSVRQIYDRYDLASDTTSTTSDTTSTTSEVTGDERRGTNSSRPGDGRDGRSDP
jgi:hypothetical protein